VLVVAAAHTPLTTHLVDSQVLAALPRGAFVVNVARGALLAPEDAPVLAPSLGDGVSSRECGVGAVLDQGNRAYLGEHQPLSPR
jgi:hypothetical protein